MSWYRTGGAAPARALAPARRRKPGRARAPHRHDKRPPAPARSTPGRSSAGGPLGTARTRKSSLKSLALGRGFGRSGRGAGRRRAVQVPQLVPDHRGELAARIERGGPLVGGAGLVGLAGLLVRGAEQEAGVLRGLRAARVLEERLERRDRLGEILRLRQRVAEAEVDDVVFGLRLELEVARELLGGRAPVVGAEGAGG